MVQVQGMAQVSNGLQVPQNRRKINNACKAGLHMHGLPIDRSRGEVPGGPVALAAGAVDRPHPVDRLADAAARPVEGRRAHVPGLLLPLAVYTRQRERSSNLNLTIRYTAVQITPASCRAEETCWCCTYV